MLKMLRDTEIIDNNSFLIMSLSMIFITRAVTPVIKFLYNSKKYTIQRRTIQHLAPNTELRMLVCIQNQDNVPATIHLLKASNPTRNSQIRVYLLHLVELVVHARYISFEDCVMVGAVNRSCRVPLKVFRCFLKCLKTTFMQELLHPSSTQWKKVSSITQLPE